MAAIELLVVPEFENPLVKCRSVSSNRTVRIGRGSRRAMVATVDVDRDDTGGGMLDGN